MAVINDMYLDRAEKILEYLVCGYRLHTTCPLDHRQIWGFQAAFVNNGTGKIIPFDMLMDWGPVQRLQSLALIEVRKRKLNDFPKMAWCYEATGLGKVVVHTETFGEMWFALDAYTKEQMRMEYEFYQRRKALDDEYKAAVNRAIQKGTRE